MSVDFIKNCIASVAAEYHITKVTLFGSRASGTDRPGSDIDLIVEFSGPTSLLTQARLRERLEAMLSLNVDIVHGPIRSTDMLEIGKVVELYAA